MGKLASYPAGTPDDTDLFSFVEDPSVPGGYHKIRADALAAWLANHPSFTSRYAALATVTPTAWTGVTFANSWGNLGAGFHAVQYRKVGDLVQMRGAASAGTIGLAICTLPAGFRPAAAQRYPVVSNSLFGWVDVQNSGVVTAGGGSNSSFDLSSVLFSTV